MVEAAELVVVLMGEVVDCDGVVLLHPELPHLLVLLQHGDILDGELVLLHGLTMGIAAFPDLAVAVVKNGVVL